MKTAFILLFLIIASLAAVASVGYSTIEETQRQYGQNQGVAKPGVNNYPPFKTALRVGFSRVGTLIHDYREEIVAIGTLVLAFATGFLYFATRDLVRGAKSVSETQLRAFVIAKGFSQAANHMKDGNDRLYVKEWIFRYDIENVGLTPATGAKAWITFQAFPISKEKQPHFEWIGEGNTAVIGPRGTGKSGFCVIPIQTMIDLWERKIEVYLAGRVEYRDIFNPSIVHHHQQCAMLDLVRHPGDVEQANQGNLPRVVFRTYGPYNSVA